MQDECSVSPTLFVPSAQGCDSGFYSCERFDLFRSFPEIAWPVTEVNGKKYWETRNGYGRETCGFFFQVSFLFFLYWFVIQMGLEIGFQR